MPPRRKGVITIKENGKEAVALSESELEQVSGGSGGTSDYEPVAITHITRPGGSIPVSPTTGDAVLQPCPVAGTYVSECWDASHPAGCSGNECPFYKDSSL